MKFVTKTIMDTSSTGLDVEDQGNPTDYVGVNIHRNDEGTYEFGWHTVIDAIIANVGIRY